MVVDVHLTTLTPLGITTENVPPANHLCHVTYQLSSLMHSYGCLRLRLLYGAVFDSTLSRTSKLGLGVSACKKESSYIFTILSSFNELKLGPTSIKLQLHTV